MGGGSGGSTGVISYPDYMQEMHHSWLTQVSADMTTYRSYNPYNTAMVYSPVSGASEVASEVYNTEAFISGHDSGSYYNTLFAYIPTAINNLSVFANANLAISIFESTITALAYDTDWQSAYDTALQRLSDSDLTVVVNALEAYQTALEGIVAGTFWTANADIVDAKVTSLISSTEADADVEAFATLVENEITTNVLPKFQSGMRDINAVMSSAFVIGEALIWSNLGKEITKYGTGLKKDLVVQRSEVFRHGMDQVVQLEKIKMDNYGQYVQEAIIYFAKKGDLTTTNAAEMLKQINMKLEMLKSSGALRNQVAGLESEFASKEIGDILQNRMQTFAYRINVLNSMIEANRIQTVMMREYIADQYAVADNRMSWPLKSYQYGNNVMAAIGSGVAVNQPNEASQARTALGGALSGAAVGGYLAAGTAMGGPVGAGLGAMIGLGMALF